MSDFIGWFIAGWWMLFLLFIFVSAFSAKRAVATDRYWAWGWLMPTAVILLLAIFHGDISFPSSITKDAVLWQRSLWADAIAGIMVVLGFAVAAWGRVTLGHNWNLFPSLQEHHQLIERGPYAYVRNPMYSGLILMLFGTVTWYGTAAGFIVFFLCLIGTRLKWAREEKILAKHFGQSYLDYKKRVSAIIPFIW